jgi:hypothetical protein
MEAGWLSDWVVRLLHLTFLATTSYATSYCMDKSVIVWKVYLLGLLLVRTGQHDPEYSSHGR